MTEEGLMIVDGSRLLGGDLHLQITGGEITRSRLLELAESEASSRLFGLSLPEALRSRVLSRIAGDNPAFLSKEFDDVDSLKKELWVYLSTLADVLQDDPLVISVLNGSTLRLILEDEDDFAMLAENLFVDLDKDDKGKLSKKEIKNALGHMEVEMGVPPFSECSDMLDVILTKHKAVGDEQLGQAQFAQLLQLVLQDLADSLSEKNVTVIRNVMVVNGSKLKKTLVHDQLFDDEVRRMFQDWIASSHEKSKKDKLQGYLTAKGLELGLPSTESNEAVELYNKIFSEVNEEVLAGDLKEEAFKVVVKDVMEKLVEQLEANPIFFYIEN